MKIARREVIKTLGLGVASGSTLLPAPQSAHHSERASTLAPTSGDLRFFSPGQYRVLRALCETIIPSNSKVDGAMEAKVPEFIDLLASENEQYQLVLGGGLMWLDATCSDRYDRPYIECSPDQQKEILDLIAFRDNANQSFALEHAIEFFALLRDLTLDGYFTSEIGIKYLKYEGNGFLQKFSGCPSPPDL